MSPVLLLLLGLGAPIPAYPLG
eukprot:COSAG06_NODE_13006_length_1303_cov_1.364618_1_plen_21_part_10